jgi:hypothetical protein
MDFQQIVGIAAGAGIGLGMTIHFSRQRRAAKGLAEKIRAELARSESVSLPDLVTRIGLRDGFMSRGKVMNAINPLVAAGEILQEEPPGTTIRNRLDVLRFRLRR